MSAEVSPQEARALCARGDFDEALDRIARVGADAAAVRRLLCTRGEASQVPAGTRTVPLTDAGGRRTEMAVHVPHGTDRGRMGALILLHGVGGSGPALLPRFTALAELQNVAILCPTAQPVAGRSNRLDLAGLFGNRFQAPCWDLAGADFPLAALRWARLELGVDPDRCMLAGTSMGALATWNLAMRYWGRFCAAVPINGGLSMWEAFGTDKRKRAMLANVMPLPLFVIHGAEDTQIPPRFDRESVAALRDLGHASLRHVEVPGGEHALQTLDLDREDSPLFRDLAGWLTEHRRSGARTSITHRVMDASHGRAYWIGLDGVAPQAVAEVHAERLSKKAIRVTVTGAREVRLHLRSDLFAPGPIEVEINEAHHVVEFRPDTTRLVRSFHDDGDPELLDDHVVVLPVNTGEKAQ